MTDRAPNTVSAAAWAILASAERPLSAREIAEQVAALFPNRYVHNTVAVCLSRWTLHGYAARTHGQYCVIKPPRFLNRVARFQPKTLRRTDFEAARLGGLLIRERSYSAKLEHEINALLQVVTEYHSRVDAVKRLMEGV